MDGQLSLYDYAPKLMTPPFWECFGSCRHFGEAVDHTWDGHVRCIYGMRRCGTSGDDVWVVDGQIYCKFYEQRARK